MNLQDWYYLLSIIFMILGILVLIIIGYVLIVIKNKIEHLHDLIDRKVTQFSRFTSDPTDTAIELGSRVANMAVKKVKSAMNKKK